MSRGKEEEGGGGWGLFAKAEEEFMGGLRRLVRGWGRGDGGLGVRAISGEEDVTTLVSEE